MKCYFLVLLVADCEYVAIRTNAFTNLISTNLVIQDQSVVLNALEGLKVLTTTAVEFEVDRDETVSHCS